jgi:hypothetical protein
VIVNGATQAPLGEPARSRAVELIETAERDTPYCICGALTSAVGEPGGVWLECTAAHAPARGLRRLVPWLDPHLWHTRRLIVEVPD